ncbi:MAG: rubrerythrin family protein [Acidobacteriaceae bacterium]|nr:rubrerythrin family protein [Acidobacteriaceae bacterium]
MAGIAADNEVTVKNLLSALEGESNASAKYNTFAIKAEADGFRGAASLFRAAARAEQIHATNHARVILQLGGQVSIKLHEIEVGSTLDNLKAALAGEQYEIDPMYPEFIAEATAHNNTAAIRTFHGAMEAEKTHARLYAEAIALVESGAKDAWTNKPRNFYVCPVCGYTSETPDEHDRCPVCNAPWDKFEVIR